MKTETEYEGSIGEQRLAFGMYRGECISSIPRSYLLWMLEKHIGSPSFIENLCEYLGEEYAQYERVERSHGIKHMPYGPRKGVALGSLKTTYIRSLLRDETTQPALRAALGEILQKRRGKNLNNS